MLQFHFNWHQLSLIAGMHFTGLCFRLHEGTVAREQVVDFLKALLAHVRRQFVAVQDEENLQRRVADPFIPSTKAWFMMRENPSAAAFSTIVG